MMSYNQAAANTDGPRSTRKRLALAALATVFLVLVVAASVVASHRRGSNDDDANPAATQPSSSIKAACGATLYQSACLASLADASNTTDELDPAEIFRLAVGVAMKEVAKVSRGFHELAAKERMDNMSRAALAACEELLVLAVDQLNESLSHTDLSSGEVVDDLKTWLSAVITYQDTCMEGFLNSSSHLRSKIAASLKNSTEFTSNGLAMLTVVSEVLSSFKLGRRLLSSEATDAFPSWLSRADRRLLALPDIRKNATIVVAKDGSGKYKTIKAAVEAVPKKSTNRTVIYVKKGVYVENVNIDSDAWNVLMVGDGKTLTVISGSLNFVDGTPTSKTATFAVSGKNFIARDMGFQNTAGAAKHQAVAVLSGSDQSVFYRCRFDAFQDTLYTLAMRQFYRECDVYGTIDFIFGNAAVVFQNCNIYARVPLPGQQDTITAQGKTDPNQNTGTSIHNCSLLPFGNLKSFKVYLGRPWKDYSTTVFMKSVMSKMIDPAGWLPWSGNSTPPGTIFYSEYMNTGPGSSTKKRVKWPGLKTMSAKQANQFTVAQFIGGTSWLPNTTIPFSAKM